MKRCALIQNAKTPSVFVFAGFLHKWLQKIHMQEFVLVLFFYFVIFFEDIHRFSGNYSFLFVTQEETRNKITTCGVPFLPENLLL